MFKRATLLVTLNLYFMIMVGCQAPTQPEIITRQVSADLDHQYALFRAQQISDIHYDYEIDITDRESFEGVAKVDFKLIGHYNSPVTIDFDQGDILSASVNGQEFDVNYDKWFIEIPPALLSAGQNHIEIAYKRPYSNDGQGLHQYGDEESKKHYLYTQFEAYAGNHFAPMFDQPDLKATFGLTVTAPETWHVITAMREESKAALSNNNVVWAFPTTELIPSYIFSLHAGPFKVWEDVYNGIPLRLFAREEMAEFVDVDDWFPTTKASFRFLESYFNYPYPFKKYDQVIVPDFNFGAMENVGAVTFSERFLSRGHQSDRQRYWHATVIAHEMAHMWFGNIVTMQWWNGLWLNESFATYLAYVTVASIPGYEDAWTYFSNLKGWAYYEDQLVTTHPIEVPAPHTGIVFNLVDGISYAKGASVLKQLAHYVGEETFQKSMANYIAKHQYANTQLADFANAIADTSGVNMDEWVDEWLLTPGLNTITVEFQCQDDYLSQIQLNQYAADRWPTLRSQRVLLGLYNSENDKMELTETIPLTYDSATNTVPLPKQQLSCPEFIYPNQKDWGYVKIKYNPTSLNTLFHHLQQFDDASMRLSLWQSIWALVHDYEISLSDYMTFLDKNIAKENDSAVLTHLVVHQKIAFDLVESMQLPELSNEVKKHIEDIMWREFLNSEPGSNRQKTFLDAAISVTFTQGKQETLVSYSKGQTGIKGVEIDPDLRWQMLIQLNRYDHKEAQKLVKSESEKDNSERARQSIMASKAIRPEMDTKTYWLKKVVNPKSDLKLADLRVVAGSLFPGSQQNFKFELADVIISNLDELNNHRDDLYFRVFGDHMLPSNCTESSVKLLEQLIEKSSSFNSVLVKKLKITHENDERCLQQKAILATESQPTFTP